MTDPQRAESRGGRRESVFVGRSRELAAIATALATPPSVVLVEGDAGVGKSRLVHVALQSDHAPDRTTLQCACPPVEPQFPLGPLLDALRRRSVHGVELSPLAGALRQLLPEWAEDLPPSLEPLPDPMATRHRLLRALAEVLDRLDVGVLVVDDGQWADAATLELLLMLTSSPESRLSVVLTYRPREVPDGSLLLRLSSHSAPHLTHVRVPVPPLTVDEVGELVGATFDTDSVSVDFVRFLHERTDGVALAVEESLALLHDRGDIVWQGGTWSRRALAELQVPPTVRDSVLERVQRLPPEAHPVLQAAAVLASPADETVLSEVADLNPEATRVGLAHALASGLLHEERPGSFAFRHVMASRAVEAAIPVSERRRLHRRAAEVLRASEPEPVARLSRHYREAHEVAEWSTYAEAAAALAMQSGDDRTAADLLVDLLTRADHPLDRRVRIARVLGETAAWGVASLGELGTQVTAALGDVLEQRGIAPPERGELRVLLGRLLLQLGEFDEAADQTSAAIPDLAGQPELAVRAMISLSWPRGRAWSGAKHLDWLRRASERLSDLPPGPERTTLEVDRASALLMLGESEGWALAEQLVNRSGSLVERRQYARCLMNVGHVAIAWGRDGEAREALDRAVALMQETGYERLLNSAALTTAYLDWHSGRWDGLAERIAVVIHADDTLPEAQLEARYTRALLQLADGDRQPAEAELRAVVAELSRRGIIDEMLASSGALSRLLLLDEKPAEALEISAPAMRTLEMKDMWPWDASIVPAHTEALVETGDAAAAAELVDRFAVGLGDRRAPGPQAALLVCRGILAACDDVDAAVGHYTAAAAAWGDLPRPYHRLLTLERLALAQLGAERTAEATETLLAVQQELHDLGAKWDADRVARRLRQLGVEVARVWRGGRRGYGNALSPRELEVARLVAQGLTNRQVAEALFLSPRTVDRHLSAVMRKLDVHSRTAVALAITEAEPADDPKIG